MDISDILNELGKRREGYFNVVILEDADYIIKDMEQALNKSF